MISGCVIHLDAHGKDDEPGNFSMVLNGKPVFNSYSRGILVGSLSILNINGDVCSCTIIDKGIFDTHISTLNADLLTEFINRQQNGTLIFGATKDDYAAKFSHAPLTFASQLGVRLNVQFRS